MKNTIKFIEGISSIIIIMVTFLKWFDVVSDKFFGLIFLTFLVIGAFSSLLDSIINLHEKI